MLKKVEQEKVFDIEEEEACDEWNNNEPDIEDYLFDAYRDRKLEEEYREQIDGNI